MIKSCEAQDWTCYLDNQHFSHKYANLSIWQNIKPNVKTLKE